MHRAWPALLVLLLLAGACSGSAPSKVSGAPTTPPDDSFETDGGLAYRVLVWSCNPRNERIVMYQTCGEGCTGCGGWALERTLCPGSTTPIEAKVASRARHPIPTGYGWR